MAKKIKEKLKALKSKTWVKKIKTFIKSLYILIAHFQTINNNPGKFILWLTTSIILSLSSFWLPILLGKIVNQDLYESIMLTNPFIIFSIVFLSNSVLLSINHIGAGKNNAAVNLRGIALVFTIMYLGLLSSVIPIKFLTKYTLNDNTQYLLLIITISLGIYVYGFRESEWEDGLSKRTEKEKAEIKMISNLAENITNDPNGIKL